MADYKLYTIDRAATRYATTYDVGNTGTAAYAVDVDQDTFWLPGNGSGRYIYVDLGSARSITGVAIGNHNIAIDATISLQWSDGSSYTNFATWTVKTAADFLMTNGTAASHRYWMVIISACTAATRLGTVSFLDSTGVITLSGDMSPRGQIGSSLIPSLAVQEGASGKQVVQVVGGVRSRISLDIGPSGMANTTDGWGFLRAQVIANSGWPNGVWITDSNYDVTTSAQEAHYCRLIDAINAAVVAPGGRVSGTLVFETMSKWL